MGWASAPGRLGAALLVGTAIALGPSARAEDGRAEETAAAVGEAEVAPRAWEFSLTAFGYHGPDEPAYGYVTAGADHDRLHLEARWNYEDLETASLWAGVNLEFGDCLRLEVTPMAGVVLGRTDGLAVGYEATLSYGRLELYTEGEWLHDLHDDASSYFYSWSELSFALSDRWRVGLVAQRTKALDTDLEVQRGVLLGLTIENVDLTAYLLNLETDEPLVAIGVTFEF